MIIMNAWTLTQEENTNFSAPSIDDRVMGLELGSRLGAAKAPLYGAVGGVAGGTIASVADATNGGTLGGAAPVIGGTIGTIATPPIGKLYDTARGFIRGRSGLESPIYDRINKINYNESIDDGLDSHFDEIEDGINTLGQLSVSDATENVPEPDNISKVGNYLRNSANQGIDNVQDLYQRSKQGIQSALEVGSNIDPRLAVAGGAGTVGALAGGTYLANRNREANMSRCVKYSSFKSPAASFKHGVYRRANFAIAGAVAGSTIGGAGGGALGGALGSGLGSIYGVYKGATYNPDVIDEQTGQRRKLGLLSRAALVSGGGALGGAAGNLAGSIAGGAIGTMAGGVGGTILPV